MIDVSDVINDPDFQQPFTVCRKSGHFGPGGWIQDPETEIAMTGVVVPSSPDDIQQLPEGDRITAAQTFYGTSAIYRTNNAGTADEIEWKGDRYRVYQVWDRSSDGGYYKAIGARMTGD